VGNNSATNEFKSKNMLSVDSLNDVNVSKGMKILLKRSFVVDEIPLSSIYGWDSCAQRILKLFYDK
jgi:hypothetical protein